MTEKKAREREFQALDRDEDEDESDTDELVSMVAATVEAHVVKILLIT